MKWTLPRSASAKVHSHESGHDGPCVKGKRCGSRAYLWKIGKVLNYAGAFLIEYSDSQDRHAGTQILEGQVEASALGQRSKTPDFCVHLHQPAPKVDLGETLVSSNSIHLTDKQRTSNGQEPIKDVLCL